MFIFDEEKARHMKQAKIHAWLLQKEVELTKHQHTKDGDAFSRFEQNELKEHKHAKRQAKMQRERCCRLEIARRRDEELDRKLRTAPAELGSRIVDHCAAGGYEHEVSMVRTFAAYAPLKQPTSIRRPKPQPPN